MQGLPPRICLVGAPDIDNPGSIPEATLKDWEAEGLIQWEGHQEDIPSLWAKSHIAVLPSHREGLPKSLLEAAAAGRPVVATDVPGCREIVEDGVTGFLVPAKDPAALAARIEALADDPTLRASMGRAGRERVVAEFAEPQVIAATLRLYQGVAVREHRS